MQRTRSRRSYGFLQAFRRWAPWIAHLALAAILNTAFDGPTWADEIGRHRALEASLVDAERFPAPPSLDELVALLTPVLERALTPYLPEQQDAEEISGQPLRFPARQKPPKPVQINRSPPAAQIAAFSPPPATVLPLLSATVATAAPAPPIPPPPSLPDLPQERSGAQESSASTAEAAPASGDGVSLLSGWNLISLPRPPDSVDPATVFSSIAGSFSIVHTYNACDAADPWRTYNPAAVPGDNDLTAVDHRPGLWVRATAAATLAISGTEPAETSIQLCQGWNLIGYPLAQPRPVLAALSSIAGKFQRVYGWDPADPVDPWEVFDVAVPAWANDLEQMQPGRGYWVYATEDTTLVMSNEGLPPEVEITSPDDGAAVTTPTDIVGIASSNLLQSWELAYRAKGETAFTTFATGNTPVINGVLGKFDPTLLLNGLYEIELTATDFQGQAVATAIDVVVEGNLKIGHFTMSFVDLEVPLVGLPIQVLRTYDSRDKRRGDFGVGWTLSVSNVRLRETDPPGDNWQGVRTTSIIQEVGFPIATYCIRPARSKLVVVTLPGGTVYRFRLKVAPECYQAAPPAVVTLSYAPEPGTTATLRPLNESSQLLVVGAFPGRVQLFDQDGTDLSDPERYLLTLQDGRELLIDQTAGLVTMTDLNRNTLTFGRNGITHSSGAGVTFERDTQGKITGITDTEGQSLTYSYNSSIDLVAATDREAAITRFTYDLNHHLLSVQDPLGRQPVRNEYDASGRLVGATDAFGRTIDLTHHLASNQEVITDRLGHSRVLEYDARGNVVRETDALGKVTTRTFDGNDQLLSETDPLGHTTRFAYDARLNLTEVVSPLGHRTRHTYNARGQVLTTTDPRGNTARNTYDSSGNLLTTEGPLGNVTAYAYDSRGNLLSETDAEGGVTRFEYDDWGNVAREIDAAGTATVSTYDRLGNRRTRTTTHTTATGTETLTWRYTYDRKSRLTATTDPEGTVSRTEYDALGNVTARIDKLGRRISFTYDDLGRQVRTDHPDATFELRAYDAEGRLVATTDRGGRVTTYLYDPLGRLVKTTFPDATSTTSTYDEAGRLVASTDARNNSTTYEYDAAGQRTRVLDALGGQTDFEYDAAGNQVAVTDANRQTTSFVYDDAGRLMRTSLPDGTHREMEYDELGRRTSVTDQAGQTTRFAYDARGRLTAVTDALDQVTRYAYDEQGKRITQTDANGHTTRFEYDALGRMTRRVLPDGAAETMTYDAAGNLESRTDLRGRTMSFAYDAAGRLRTKTYPDGTSVGFTYTPTGQRATMVDARGTTSYAYDPRDRLVEMVYPDGPRLTYGWDGHGNRIEVTAHVAGQVLQTRSSYDELSRLDTVTDPRGQVYDHGYDPNGNRTSVLYPNGVRTTYTYDALNRLTEQRTRSGVSTAVQTYLYTLGPAGNRTRIEEADGTVKTYGYDALYRLTSESVTLGGGTVYTTTFGYDPVGNRLQRFHTDATGTVTPTNATFDARDRQLTRGAQAWTWDANGNLTAKADEATYAWDFDDRLQTVTLHDGTVITHTYDADGVRVRTETRKADGTTTAVNYLVDNSGPLSQVVAETTQTGAGVAILSACYVRGDDLLAVMRPGGAAGTWTSRFFHADGLGSIRALTDEAGAVTDRYAFSAFGELLSHEGEDPNPFLFAGELLDTNSGFYYNRARWMDPGAGRFASGDRFPGSAFDPPSLHRYLYANADPANRLDPTGLYSLAEFLTTASIIMNLASIVINISQGFRSGRAAARALAEGRFMDATALEANAILHYGVAAISAFGLIAGLPPGGSAVPALAANAGAGPIWSAAATNPRLLQYMINQIAPALLGSTVALMSQLDDGGSGGGGGDGGGGSSGGSGGSVDEPEALRRFAQRLEEAGIRVKRISPHIRGKEFDIELENGALLEYRGGVSSAHAVIKQYQKGLRCTDEAIIYFLDSPGRAALRTVRGAGSRVPITNDFELLVSVLKDPC